MKKTETLGLNQWELSDPIRMEDFNADNAILETTLRTLTASPVEVIAREDGANAMNGYASEPCRFDICGVNWDEWKLCGGSVYHGGRAGRQRLHPAAHPHIRGSRLQPSQQPPAFFDAVLSQPGQQPGRERHRLRAGPFHHSVGDPVFQILHPGVRFSIQCRATNFINPASCCWGSGKRRSWGWKSLPGQLVRGALVSCDGSYETV